MTSPALTGDRPRALEERRIIVMIGAPGAGKGTQAALLAKELGLPHISTGELFRSAVKQRSELGGQVRAYVERGALVPDAVTVRVVDDRLRAADAEAGAILDGFPRTRAQAEALDRILGAVGSRVTAALYVEVPSDELVKRLSGRRVCSADDQHVYHIPSRPPKRANSCDVDGAALVQRKDDEPETVRSRLEQQMPPMYEVVDHYAETGVLSAVRGDKAASDVSADLLRVVGSPGRVS